MLSDGLSALLLPYLVLVAVNSALPATFLGLVTLAGLALGMIIQPVAGALSDTMRRRRPMMIGGAAIAFVGLAALGVGSTIGVLAVLLGYLVAVAGANITQAGLQAMIPDRVPGSRRGRAAGLKGLMDVGGAFAAFAVLAVLLADGRVVIGLVVLGAGLSLTVAVGAFSGAASERSTRPPRADLNPSTLWSGLGQRRAFTTLLISRFFFLLGIYAVGRFLLLFMGHRLGLDAEATASEAGIVLAMLALLTAVASVPAGWAADRMGRRPMMVGGAAVAAIGMGLLPLAENTPQITFLGGLLALGTASFGAGSWALATDLVPRKEAGRHMGLANYATAGAAAAAGLLGPIVDAGESMAPGIGFTVVMLLAATAALAGGIIAIRLPDATAASPLPVPTGPTPWKD